MDRTQFEQTVLDQLGLMQRFYVDVLRDLSETIASQQTRIIDMIANMDKLTAAVADQSQVIADMRITVNTVVASADADVGPLAQRIADNNAELIDLTKQLATPAVDTVSTSTPSTVISTK